VVTSGGRSSSTVRRTRGMTTLVLRRRVHATSPLSPSVLRRAIPPPLSSPPIRRRAVPTSLSLSTAARNLLPVSSITVSLPRSFASDLVPVSRDSVTDAAVTPSPVTVQADDEEAVMAEDNVTSLPAGVCYVIHSIFHFYRKLCRCIIAGYTGCPDKRVNFFRHSFKIKRHLRHNGYTCSQNLCEPSKYKFIHHNCVHFTLTYFDVPYSILTYLLEVQFSVEDKLKL